MRRMAFNANDIGWQPDEAVTKCGCGGEYGTWRWRVRQPASPSPSPLIYCVPAGAWWGASGLAHHCVLANSADTVIIDPCCWLRKRSITAATVARCTAM